MARTGRIVLPLLLMGVIFYLSAQPDLNSGLGTWDAILRKGAHMTEYGLLWFLWTRVVGPFPALAICLAWAASDEFHQTFVEGRHGTPVDVAIDAAGMGIAAAIWVTWQVRRAREDRLVADTTRTR